MKYLNRFNESINTNDIKLDTPFSELSIPSVTELISNSLKKYDVSVDIKKFYTDKYSLFISPHNSNKVIAVDIVKYMWNDNKTEVISEYYIDEKGDFIQGIQFKEDILNMKDFFIFISKYIPEIVTNRVLKKINESDKKVNIEYKFILFLGSLEEWNSTNEHMYEIEQKWDSGDEVEVFEDSNYHVATLFENENEELIDNQDYDDITSISESIEYFVQFRYSSNSDNMMDFYVYENEEFRKANGEENSYFRGLDDECYLSDRPYIMSIEYDDWKKNKIDTINAIKKINR